MHILYENVTKYNLESSPLLTELLIRWYLSPPIVVRHRVYLVVTFSHPLVPHCVVLPPPHRLAIIRHLVKSVRTQRRCQVAFDHLSVIGALI